MSAKKLILETLYRTGLFSLARRFNRDEFLGCRVVNFHRVLPSGTPADHYAALMGEPTADQLDHLIQFLKCGFRFTTPRECVERWRAGEEVEPYSLILTFDDGYADLHANLLPLLQKHEVPATVFITTSAIEGKPLWFQRLFAAVARTPLSETPAWEGLRPMPLTSSVHRTAVISTVAKRQSSFSPDCWSERIDALCAALGFPEPAPGEEMMSWEQVGEMHRSGWVTLGGHTVTHPLLTRCEPERIQWELAEGARVLRERFDLPFLPFAYPNGDHSEGVEEMVSRAGYDCAFIMKPARNRLGVSPFRLGRQYLPASDLARAAYSLSGLHRLPVL